MLVVALAGLLMGGGVLGHRMWRLSRYYAAKAQEHWSEEIKVGRFMAHARRVELGPGNSAELLAAWLVYHEELTEKYKRAARYPWFHVEPDPPTPKNPFYLGVLRNVDISGLP
jgi:hypothetical protein